MIFFRINRRALALPPALCAVFEEEAIYHFDNIDNSYRSLNKQLFQVLFKIFSSPTDYGHQKNINIYSFFVC